MAKTAAKWYQVKAATHATPVSDSSQIVHAIQLNSDSVEELKTLLGESAKAVEETVDGDFIVDHVTGSLLVKANDYVVFTSHKTITISDQIAFEANYSWLPLKSEVSEEEALEEEDPDGED